MPNLNLLTILGLDSTTSEPARLLDPSIVLVDTLTDALDHGALAGSGLASLTDKVDTAAADLIGAVNTVIEPLVGDGFAANHPNDLDPVDNLVGSVATTVKSAVGADIDALLGAGATASLLAPAGLEVDYVTDVLAHEFDALGLGAVSSQLATVEDLLAPVNATLAPLEAQIFALGGDLGAPVTGLLGSLGGSGGIAPGALLGDLLAPASGVVDTVAGLLGSVGFAGSIGSSASGLLGVLPGLNLVGEGTTTISVAGDTSLLGGLLSTITGTTDGLTGSLLGSLPVLGTPALGGLLAPVTALVGDLLGTLQGSATSGILHLGSGDLLAPVDTVLALAEQLDPTGALGPVAALPAVLGDVVPLPTGAATVDASGLVATVGTVEALIAPVLDLIPSISSLGGPLATVAGLTPATLLGSLPSL